jgi:hypothetical protein
MGTTVTDGANQPPSNHASSSPHVTERRASRTWDSWEVFDPRDGQTRHFTDCERTAEQVAVEEELRTGEPRDYGRKGMEPDGRSGWRPWRPAFESQAHLLRQAEVDLIEDNEVDLTPPDLGPAPDMGRGL